MSLQVIRYIADFTDALFPLLGAFIILGEDIKKHWFKTLVFSVIFGTLVWFTDQIDINTVRMLINMVASLLLFKCVFRLNNWFTVKVFIIYYLLIIFTNSLLYYVVIYGLKMPLEQTRMPISFWLTIYFPWEITNILVAFAVSKLRTKILYFFAQIKGNFNLSVIRSLVVLIVVQVALIISMVIDVLADANFSKSLLRTGYLSLALFLVIILNALILIKSISISVAKTLEATQDAVSHSIMSLVNSVRSQRHDFINHIQVLNSLLHANDIEGIRHYLLQLSSDTAVYNDILKINNPVIGALLNAKMTQAGLKDIKIEVDIYTDLSNIATKAFDLTRILGNLIDNAVEAVEQLDSAGKWVKVTIGEKGPFLVFTVLNPGLPPAESTEKLFEPGFTTKDDSHSGLGLYICKQIAQKLHGSIDYKYSPLSGISFSLVIPKS